MNAEDVPNPSLLNAPTAKTNVPISKITVSLVMWDVRRAMLPVTARRSLVLTNATNALLMTPQYVLLVRTLMQISPIIV
jgi:hypothetical protein